MPPFSQSSGVTCRKCLRPVSHCHLRPFLGTFVPRGYHYMPIGPPQEHGWAGSSLCGDFDILGVFSRQGMVLGHFLCIPNSPGTLRVSAIGFCYQVWIRAHVFYRLGSGIIGSRPQREAVSSVWNNPREVPRAHHLCSSPAVRCTAGRPYWFTCAE